MNPREFPKRFPFRVPEGYHASAADAMTDAFMAETTVGIRKSRSYQMAAAAIFTGLLIASAGWLYLESTSHPACVTFACLLEETETELLESEYEQLMEEAAWDLELAPWSSSDSF